MTVKITNQEDLIVTDVCYFQTRKGNKFIRGLAAITKTDIRLYSDNAPTTKMGDFYTYDPELVFLLDDVFYVTLVRLTNHSELSKFTRLDVKKDKKDVLCSIFFKKNESKKLNKFVEQIGLVRNPHKIKISKKEEDCSAFCL